MILKAQHLLLLLVASLTGIAAVPVRAGNVYLAIRGDGRGVGSQSDPYDGANPDGFDWVLAHFPSGTDFQHAPGTYLTD